MLKSERIGDLEAIPAFAVLLSDPMWRAMTQRTASSNKLVDILWSDTAFRAWQSFCRAPHPENINPESCEYRLLISMGRDVAGWQDIAHGAILMMLLDESMQELAKEELGGNTFTREMTTAFEKPLRLPATVMVRAWSQDKAVAHSRKLRVLCNVEDSVGNVYVSGRAVFIKVKPQL